MLRPGGLHMLVWTFNSSYVPWIPEPTGGSGTQAEQTPLYFLLVLCTILLDNQILSIYITPFFFPFFFYYQLLPLLNSYYRPVLANWPVYSLGDSNEQV